MTRLNNMSLRSPKVMIALLALLLASWYTLEQTTAPEQESTVSVVNARSPAPATGKNQAAETPDRFDYVFSNNLFPEQSWAPPQAPAEAVVETLIEPEQPAEPVAPRLPFAYLGRMQEGSEEVVIFVTRNDVVYSIQSGDVLDGTWKLSQVHSYGLEWTYLPLNMTHIIRTPL
jgi:hypothetical protein